MLLSTGRFFGASGGGGGGGTPWTPASLTGLLAWHDVSDAASITSASSLISAWNDKSGSGNHLTESSLKPNYSGSVQLNGYNVVDCGHFGSGTRMRWSSAITTAKAVFLVIGTGTNANSEGGGFLLGGSSTYPFHRGGGSSAGALYSDSLLNTTFADAAFASASAIGRRNGVNIFPGFHGFEGESKWHGLWMISTGAAAGSFYAINEDRADSSRYGGSDYAAIVVLSAIPSSDDIKRLEGYYKNRFSSLKLPEIHPYVSAAPIAGDTPTDTTLAPHRYGRLSCICTVSTAVGFSGMSELEVYETIGGSNAIAGATLTTSTGTPSSSGSLANLTDGNLSTTQAQWTGIPFDVTVDFGSGNAKAINQIGIAPNKDDADRSPKWIIWQVSDDGSTWTDSWPAKFTGTYTIGSISKISAGSI